MLFRSGYGDGLGCNLRAEVGLDIAQVLAVGLGYGARLLDASRVLFDHGRVREEQYPFITGRRGGRQKVHEGEKQEGGTTRWAHGFMDA